MKLSIIIPAYNTGNLIQDTVRSIAEQSFQDWQLIIVNDGSTDNTAQICEQLAKQDSRITIIHTPNRGAYKARLTGIEHAEGDWLMFVDSDDTITTQCVEGLFKHAKDGIDIVAGTLNINNKSIFRHKIDGLIDSDSYTEAILLSNTSIGLTSKIFRKKLFGTIPSVNSKITNNEDLLLLLTIAQNAGNIYIDNSLICYNYIFRPNSGRFNLMTVDTWQLLFNSIHNILRNPDSTRFRSALSRLIINRSFFLIRNGVIIDKKYPFVSSVKDCDKRLLTFKERVQLDVLQSPSKQKIASLLYKCSRILTSKH